MKTCDKNALDTPVEIEEAIWRAQRREQDWQHKQRLDGLLSFSEKLRYWKEEVCERDLIFGKRYTNEPCFELNLVPETEDEQKQLNSFWLEWYRAFYIQRAEPINRFAWKYSTLEPVQVAFFVRSFNSLKAELEEGLDRQTNVSLKIESLTGQLEDVSRSLDAVCRSVNGHEWGFSKVIIALRKSLRDGKEYYLGFDSPNAINDEILYLAQVWDMVHYERYLLVRKTNLENSTVPIRVPNNEKDICQVSEDTQRKARQAVSLFENQIEFIVTTQKGMIRQKSVKTIVEEAFEKYRALSVALNLGKSLKAMDRYLKYIGKPQTTLQYGRQFIGQLRRGK